METQSGSPETGADVIIANPGRDTVFVKVTGIKDMAKAGEVADGLASYIRQETLEPIDVLKNPADDPNTITITGRMSSNKDDFNSPGAVAASLVIGLVEAGEMSKSNGFNALARFESQEAIDHSMRASALEKIGYTPKILAGRDAPELAQTQRS